MKKDEYFYLTEEGIKQQVAKNNYQFIMHLLLFVLILFLTVYFVFSYFPIYEFALKCAPIFPILSKFLMFLCSPIGKAILVIDAFIGFFLIQLNKLKQIT